LAGFSERQDAFRNAGANLVALSVDPPERAEEVRRLYGISFPVLCDMERRVVRDWNLYNAEERGGIAIPAVFLLALDLRVLFACAGSVASRVRADDLLEALPSLVRRDADSSPPASPAPTTTPTEPSDSRTIPHNRAIIPRLPDFARAFGAAIRVKFASPRK
jgi:hypothetical protein